MKCQEGVARPPTWTAAVLGARCVHVTLAPLEFRIKLLDIVDGAANALRQVAVAPAGELSRRVFSFQGAVSAFVEVSYRS